MLENQKNGWSAFSKLLIQGRKSKRRDRSQESAAQDICRAGFEIGRSTLAKWEALDLDVDDRPYPPKTREEVAKIAAGLGGIDGEALWAAAVDAYAAKALPEGMHDHLKRRVATLAAEVQAERARARELERDRTVGAVLPVEREIVKVLRRAEGIASGASRAVFILLEALFPETGPHPGVAVLRAAVAARRMGSRGGATARCRARRRHLDPAAGDDRRGARGDREAGRARVDLDDG